MPENKTGIRDLIYQVKKELLEMRADDPVPAFFVEGVELELAVAVEGEGSAGIKIYVVDLSSQVRKENTQTVKVKLQSLYTREELRKILEADPSLKEKMPATAKQVVVKEIQG